MPIAKYQLPDGRVARFEVPEGTTAEQAQKIGQDYFSSQAQADQPVEQEARTFNEALLSLPGMPLLAEFAAGANRSIADIVDFFGPGAINAALEIAGSDARVPTAREGLEKIAGPSGRGEFAEGLPGQIAATVGELVPSAAAAGTALRSVASSFGPQVAGESVGRGVTRQLAQTTPAQDIGAAVASGIGQEAGRAIGGETGALVGGIAAPTLGAFASQGAKTAITNKFGKRVDLIDPGTALPAPALQKALDRKGLSFAAVTDEPNLVPYVSQGQTADQVVDSVIKRKIASNSTSKSLAPIRIESGNIVSDEVAKRAINQGFDPGDIQMIKGSNNYSRGAMQKMLKMKRNALEDRSVTFRPGDVVGDDVFKRIEYVRGQANKLRLELDDIAKSELKGQKINTFEIQDEVLKNLDELNIQIPESVRQNPGLLGKSLSKKGAFNFSDISKSKSDQKIIKDVIDLLSEEGAADALRAHRLKRQMDRMIDYKRSQSLLTPAGEKFTRNIRSALNKSIRDVNSRYAGVNDDLSASLQALSGITDVMPKKINLFSESANQSIGQELRKLVTNYNTRIPMQDAIKDLDDVSLSLGGKFEGEVFKMINFATALDDRFGEAARGGFGAKIESATRRALTKEGVVERAIEKGVEAVQKKRGFTEEGAFNDMQKLLIRGK